MAGTHSKRNMADDVHLIDVGVIPLGSWQN
jgi:hypothetical protein